MPMSWLIRRCRYCKSVRLHRLRTHTVYERIRSVLIVPVRCDTCCREFSRFRIFAPSLGARMPKRTNILIRKI
jgi:hypothetical protein